MFDGHKYTIKTRSCVGRTDGFVRPTQLGNLSPPGGGRGTNNNLLINYKDLHLCLTDTYIYYKDPKLCGTDGRIWTTTQTNTTQYKKHSKHNKQTQTTNQT